MASIKKGKEKKFIKKTKDAGKEQKKLSESSCYNSSASQDFSTGY